MSFTAESSRPLLLPQNRRLRHLQGIYLRNLSFTRPRGRTIDDSEINKSPSKTEALRDGPLLHHALSSENLRPSLRSRRRSTNLAYASPVTRQKQLEYAIDSRAADVFFSLHIDGEDDPVYISEVEERSTNFNFRFFDLATFPPSITRSSILTVKVWAKRQTWSLLLSETTDLRNLNFLGTLRHRQFPPNSLVFHLIDGVYSLDLPSKEPPLKRGHTLPTSPYNTLMKLSNLETSIQDSLATRDALAQQISEILSNMPTSSAPQAVESARLAQSYVSATKRQLSAAQARKAALETSIAARRESIASGLAAQSRAASDVEAAEGKLPDSQTELISTKEAIHGQRRRVCEDLAAIFPITPSPSGTALSFHICGLPLPNTDYDPASNSRDEDALNAALGYTAHLTDALQYYLGVPLPYPLTTFGSRSSVRDDISATLPDSQRSFPLFLRGGAVSQYRFDYGWFLLNKNIEALCAASGLKIVDLRHTLPNLKYLLYVCGAGTDEVPERKRGGVRGLWAGRMKGRGLAVPALPHDGGSSAGGSRRASDESEATSRRTEELRKVIGGMPGSAAVAAAVDEGVLGDIGLPFEEGSTLTLRTKGLRENVVR